jgi:hypothetical protein
MRRFDEHVDDHEVAFTWRLYASGDVLLAETEAGLHVSLSRAVADPGTFPTPSQQPRTAEAALAFGRLVEDLLAAPERRRGTRAQAPRTGR